MVVIIITNTTTTITTSTTLPAIWVSSSDPSYLNKCVNIFNCWRKCHSCPPKICSGKSWTRIANICLTNCTIEVTTIIIRSIIKTICVPAWICWNSGRIGNVQLLFTSWQFCTLDGVLIIKQKINSRLLHTIIFLKNSVKLCLHLSYITHSSLSFWRDFSQKIQNSNFGLRGTKTTSSANFRYLWY